MAGRIFGFIYFSAATNVCINFMIKGYRNRLLCETIVLMYEPIKFNDEGAVQ
jgi:hypothetical protein